MNPKMRLDQALVIRGLVSSRSQATSYIKLGSVKVNGRVVTKAGEMVNDDAKISLDVKEQYVSRAGLKLASVAEALHLDFKDKLVLDVGSSTGGFTEYALKHGAKKIIAVEVGTNQLHPSLRGNERIELHEQTDIRDVVLNLHEVSSRPQRRDPVGKSIAIEHSLDLVLADVSFISLRDILPHVASLCSKTTRLAVMVKPQFEATHSNLKHKGVIKNDKMRRDILKDFEHWATQHFVIINKADSSVAGAKGNQERFYLLKLLSK